MVPLSVLDTAPIGSGQAAGHVEKLRFRRFWVAEHHGFPTNASSAPPVLIAHLAAATSRIRVGSGGVMLGNHTPLVVAEQFGTLESLHPGRIDLGIDRAPGADPATARALRRGAEPLTEKDYADQVAEHIAYFCGDAPVRAVPGEGLDPELWLLSSTLHSARLAGELGRPFAFAHHFSAANMLPALSTYRASFRPSAALARPQVMIATIALCAATDAAARRLALPTAVMFLNLVRGRPGPIPTPDEAAARSSTPEEQQFVDDRLAEWIIGSPGTMRTRVDEFVHRTGLDELMVLTIAHDPADRLRSYELLAAAQISQRGERR